MKTNSIIGSMSALMALSIPFAACRSAKSASVETFSAVDSVSVEECYVRDVREDSNLRIFYLSVDSPEIIYERLDSPRVRVKARAARAKVFNSIETASLEVAANDTKTAKTKTSDSGYAGKSSSSRSSPSLWWWLASALSLMAVAAWLRRKTAVA